jgi:Family of unknown function (DUF5312)
MEDKSVFNRLIMGLTQIERLEMLKKMQHISPINDLPLKDEKYLEEYDFEESYKTFSVFEKIIIFFTVLFSTKERDKVIETLSMDKLAKKLEKSVPDLINYNSKKFLNKFLVKIENLQESLAVFNNTLPLIFKSNESDFIAFLVGLHFPEVEARLLESIDPQIIASDFEFESSFQLKRHIEFRIDEILGEIDLDKKKIIYKELKNLHVLKALTLFNFENILTAFRIEGSDNSLSCGFIDIRKPLHQLLDILFSLNISPSIDTLNAVFIFNEELSHPDSNDDLEKILKLKLEDANISFECIRKFNLEVPLESILCLVNHNMNFHPAHIGGAEDWSVLFRRFWFKKFDLMMVKYTEREKKIQLEENASFFLNLSKKTTLSNYKKGLWDKDENVKFEATAGFIAEFMTGIFNRELVKPLKLVLIDGQFYKEQNRLDYNKSYRTIIEVVDLFNVIENKLSPAGEYKSGIERLKVENTEEAKESIQELKLYIDTEFGKIIVGYNLALGLLIDVVSGIVQGEMGGVYDTLSNLGYIGKGENKNLLTQLNDIRFKLDEARNISYQLYDLENLYKI